MLRFYFLFSVVFFSVGAMAQESDATAITTYYFVRHAEKNRMNDFEEDVHLNEDGYKRAQAWKEILQHISFDAVYTTNFNRTKETGLPTALKNGVPLTFYNVADSYNDQFKNATQGKTVLIVGHSNTIPDFVNAVIRQQKYRDIDDDNNGNLYIVTIIKGHISDLLLTIN